MNWTTKWIGIGCLTLSLGGAAAAGQSPGRQGHPRFARAMRNRPRGREGILRLLDSLQATDAQRAVALEAAKAAEPIASAARSEVARLRAGFLAKHADDRDAARTEMRERVQELRRKTLAELAPLASRVLDTLTPEQRQKLDEAATKRGKTLDEERLVKITSYLLTRPATVPRLEGKLGR